MTEQEFIEFAARRFCQEYNKNNQMEPLRFVRVPTQHDRFPDAVVASTDGPEFGIELAGITMDWVNKEMDDRGWYIEAIGRELSRLEPSFNGARIMLQRRFNVYTELHAPRLPRPESKPAKRLVVELCHLLKDLTAWAIATYGSPFHRNLLREEDRAQFPVATRYFEAILLDPLKQDMASQSLAEDPVIHIPGLSYRPDVVERAVVENLRKKITRGRGYSCRFLVLHALREDDVSPDMAFHTAQVIETAKRVLSDQPMSSKFDEVWFLNAAYDAGRRLYRLH